MLLELANGALTELDKLAMVWFARNRLYFELGLDSRNDVLLLKYNDIIERPTSYLSAIYEHLDMTPPHVNMGSPINAKSATRGESDHYHPGVANLCNSFEAQLDKRRLVI